MKRKLVKILICLAASTAALTIGAGCEFPEREDEEDDRYSIVLEITKVLVF
ncbi:hypothetical protein Ple7327_0962 [Pleurocapsa sp. PCC 7327]|uniref:hypothetical protein n=1 Tax=Pleurocapsa sp. PCC 7327 TaxID=118163 RepID=UPI00029FA47F|nr:hypothetical protein [Pleurocapsa sp. PCC 7327]AFY76384.1 hypothetical protein Ple7327_0962 [Pleurocapsa sp. PCC 7327]